MPCMCGADDCYACHPELFRVSGRSRIYIGDMDDKEADEAVARAEEAAEAREDAQRDAREWAAEHGGA